MKFTIIVAEDNDIQDEFLKRLMTTEDDKKIHDIFVNPANIIGVSEYKVENESATKAAIVMGSGQWLHVEESFFQVAEKLKKYWFNVGTLSSVLHTAIDVFDLRTSEVIESEDKGSFFVVDYAIEYIRKYDTSGQRLVGLINKDEIVAEYIETSLEWFGD